MVAAEVVERVAEQYSDQDLQDMLPIYYKRLFPHKIFYRWLSYGEGNSTIFSNREFSFTLKDDVYIRYLSFDKQIDLETELCAKNPFKIDIGPVMNAPPKHQRAKKMLPVQRELIFDIDMTDYDDVRTCCSGAEVCVKCWKFMVVACQVVDAALREDFNFEHILWVFSGRRGIHGWVCDSNARNLNAVNRNAVAEYLNILSGSGPTKINTGENMHHSLLRAHRIVSAHFEEIIVNDQNVFGSVEGRKKLLDMLPDDNLRSQIEPDIMAIEANNSKAVWDRMKLFVQNIRGNNRRTKHLLEEIQLAMLYPRLDIAVTKAANHLLKSPFCVHPKTGKICVPFNPSAIAKFDPTSVPTIRQLLKAIDQFDKNAEKEETVDATQTKRILDYRKTEMYKGIFVFEEFLRKLESSYKIKRIHVSDAKMEF